MTLIRIGRVGRPHGLHGEVSIDEIDLTANELHDVRHFTWRGRDGSERTLELHTARPTHGRILAGFHGIADRDAAAELGLGELWAERERLPDPGPGQAYTFELIGLTVEDESGRALGTLTDIVALAAHPVYVVQGDKELLIPATPEVLRRVDREAGRIVVALPRGLEEI